MEKEIYLMIRGDRGTGTNRNQEGYDDGESRGGKTEGERPRAVSMLGSKPSLCKGSSPKSKANSASVFGSKGCFTSTEATLWSRNAMYWR